MRYIKLCFHFVFKAPVLNYFVDGPTRTPSFPLDNPHRPLDFRWKLFLRAAGRWACERVDVCGFDVFCLLLVVSLFIIYYYIENNYILTIKTNLFLEKHYFHYVK